MTILSKPAVETAQTEFELDVLVGLFERLQPQRILEIGTWHGGTLWHWLQAGTTVVSVDDTMFEAADWQQWADDAGSTLHLVQGFSYQPRVVEQVRSLGPYDFLFIDAEHTYEAVRADWVNYSPMVNPGGMIVLHDFQPRVGPYGVDRLWAEIKSQPGARTVEIVETNEGFPGFQGVAAVWV